jgi:endonuclease/exonuclease/phosphatase family metal-dependent hydrolase
VKRAKLQAAEIKAAKPDLVGLQEVALWRKDVAPPAQDGPQTPGETVEFDFLDLLMDELEKQGADYRIVRVQKEIDIETPLSGGDPGDGRLTMRDVVLAREGAGVHTKNDFSQRFQKENSLVVEDIGGISGFDVTVWRGFVAMDANVRGTKFRFVNTHFEAFDNTAKLAQAEELVAGLPESGPANPESVARPVVLVGDLNTDNEIVETLGDTPQHQADELPYAEVVDAGLEERSFDGLNSNGVDAQYSCCFNAELIDEAPATALDDIDHTVDHVMVSDDDHGAGNDTNSNDVTLVNSFATGQDPASFAMFNRWASDHLGVVSSLQFP